jgi:hypothetical protein
MPPAHVIHVIRSVPSRDAGKPSVKGPLVPDSTSCVAVMGRVQIRHAIIERLLQARAIHTSPGWGQGPGGDAV